MNQNNISIIIPVYNAESFLDKCIKSITDQSYMDYELLLINDGSSDRSEEICLSFAKCDNRIKYIKKANGGVSSARNLGIEKSTGKFIMFIDADDYVDKDFFADIISVEETTNYDL